MTLDLWKLDSQDKISNTHMLDKLNNALQTPLAKASKHAFGGGGKW